MKKPLVLATLKICVLVIVASTANAANLSEKTVKEQNEIHKQWWGEELEWRFDELPATGMVEKMRVPWAGHIYPDSVGGCIHVLRKYDQAFHKGRSLSADFERKDIEVHKTTQTRRGGLFGRRVFRVVATPSWAGHCNGWTAAAIRHAEPKDSVTRNGVVFAPSDIKGLLAELYVYSNHELLGGEEGGAVNPAIFHVNLANWLGLGQHPIAMDNTLGEEIWNYPIYSYKSSSTKHSDRIVEVSTNIGYVSSTNQEFDVAPKRYQFLYLHYQLDLDADGKVIGGSYYRDSNRLDLLWVPLQPTKGGGEGNKQGNPHLDVKEVLSLWRDSVPEEFRKEWYNVNPYPEDAVGGPDEESAATENEESTSSPESSEESTSSESEQPASSAESAP
jgi:hypothetical protein